MVILNYRLPAIGLLFFFFFIFTFRVTGQDVHHTQFYTSLLSFNPALTGYYDGDVKVAAISRNQWRQVVNPIRTNMLSFEKKILLIPDEIGIGFVVINDFVTTSNFHTNKAMLSGSYTKRINGHGLRIGIQGGIVNSRIDMSKQTFPVQFDYGSGMYDPNISNQETNLMNSHYYPDFSAGLAWSKRVSKVKFMAGYSLFHISRPQLKFIQDGDKLPFRHVGNASVIWNVNSMFSITPHLLYMRTARATDFLVIANGRKMVNEDLGFLVGAGYRGSSENNDAGIAVAGFIYKRFEVGLSMDFNVSGLSADTRRKLAWEISLIYLTPSRIANKVTIPCDRY